MDVKPGYKQTEVGVIPEDWKTLRLQDIGQWKGGATPSMKNDAFWNGGTIPWASSGDIKSSQLVGTELNITDAAVKQTSTTLLPKDSIIIVTRSGILRRYLPVAKNKVPLAINQDIKAIIPNSTVASEYILQILLANGLKILAKCLKTGTTVESVDYSWLKAFQIPISPMMKEQLAIAAALSDVDALIAALDRLIAKKRDIKQAAMQELLTGKKRLPGFGDDEICTEAKKTPPNSWRGLSIYDLVENIIDYRGRTPRKLGMVWGEGEIPALSANNVKMGYIDFREETYFGSEALYKRWMTNGRSKKDDIVVTMEAPLGNIAQIPNDKKYILSQRTILLQINNADACNRFIFYFMTFQSFQKVLAENATGTTAKGIQRKKFEKLEIVLPPVPEQQAIAAILSDMDAEITALEARREKTRALKQGMMQGLLTGRIRLV